MRKIEEQTSWSASDYVESLRHMGVRCTGMNEGIESWLQEEFLPVTGW